MTGRLSLVKVTVEVCRGRGGGETASRGRPAWPNALAWSPFLLPSEARNKRHDQVTK